MKKDWRATSCRPRLARAYMRLRDATDHPKDASNDALMILATIGWKPRLFPKRELASGLQIFRQPTQYELDTQQHPVFELEIFLVVKAWLKMAEDRGEYSVRRDLVDVGRTMTTFCFVVVLAAAVCIVSFHLSLK